MNRFIKRAVAVVAALCMVVPLVACSKIPNSTKEERQTVLSIDEFEVSYELYRYFICNYMDSLAAGDEEYWTQERADTLSEDIHEATFSSLKNLYAVLSLCKKYGIERDDKAIQTLVDSAVENATAEYGDESAFADALAENHMTLSVFRFLTTVDLCRNELYYAMLNDGTIEPDLEKIASIVRSDAFIRIKQILIANDAGESESDTRQKAENLRRRAMDGEDFDALVQEYGKDLFMFNNTDGYYLCRGVWHKAFEDAAFSLEIGEISDVVKTDAGFSILLRCEKDPAFIDANLDELCDDYREAQFCLILEEKANSMKITRYEILEKYTLLTIK